MRTIPIRGVRADLLHQLGEEGKLAGITDSRVLIGVFCPVGQDLLIHVLAQNQSRLKETVPEGEEELRGLQEVTTLKDLIDAGESSDAAPGTSGAALWGTLEAVQPLVQALSAVVDLAATRPQHTERVGQRTIRVGDISAKEIKDAAEAGQLLVVTDRRELVGIIIPINQKLVAYIVEQNLSRVKRNVLQGELEYQSGAAQTLAEVLTAAAVPV
jgi:hypothetical protein